MYLAVFATIGGGLHGMGQMAIWGMSSMSMVTLEDSNSPEQQRPILTPEQFSWFASLPLLMSMLGSPFGGMLTEYFGPRKFMLVMAPAMVVSSVALHAASWQSVQAMGLAATVLLVVRVIQSFIVGLALSVWSQYPCEITDLKQRGILGSLTDVWSHSGYVLCYLGNYFFHWTTLTWILPLITFLPSSFILLMSPESPLWLLRKGKESEALDALFSLRNTRQEALNELKTLEEDSEETKQSFSFHILKKKKNISKPLVISALMVTFKELAGNMAIAFFIVNIFKSTGLGLDPNLSSAVVGSTRVLSNLIGSFLLQLLPRKLMLISGSLCVAIVNAVFGTVYFLQSSGQVDSYLNWVLLAMLILFMLGYGLGIGTVSWMVSIEILPNNVRSFGCGLTFATYSATAFMTIKTFTSLQESVGLYGTFWIYSAAACLYAIFIAIFVPETRGCTLLEIQKFWEV